MKGTDSQSRINGVHLAEINITNHINQPQMMGATYALARLEGGGGKEPLSVADTHGKCTANTNNWSKRTWELLQELLDSMESDLLPRHFEEESNVEQRTESRELEEVGQI